MVNTTSKRAPKAITPANPWVRGLYPGTHTSMRGDKITFTPADIASHVDKVKAQVAPGMATPPLVTGHPKHDDPRVGSVVDVELREDGAAWYKLDALSPAFCEACQRGEYTYSSPKLNRDGSLRHLGALGAWSPSLKEQPGFAFGEAPEGAEADEGVLAFGVESDWGSVTGGWLNRIAWRLRSLGSILRRQREAMIEKEGVEAADKILPNYEIENLEGMDIPYDITPASSASTAAPAFGDPAPADGADEPAPAPAAVFAPAEHGHSRPLQNPEAPAPVDVEVARLRAELDEANRKLAEKTAEESSKAFGEKLERTIAEGRLSPVVAAKFQSLFTALASSGELAFAEGDPVRSELEALLDSLPKLVEFGELPEGRNLNPTAINPLVANAEARAAAAKERT
jgi:hypothetical protein